MAERFVEVHVGMFGDKEFALSDLTFVKDEYEGDYYKFPGAEYGDRIMDLTTKMWDAKKKCFCPVVDLEYKGVPDEKYVIGQTYYVEVPRTLNSMREDELIGIEYQETSVQVGLWKHVGQYLSKHFEDKGLLPKQVVRLIQMEPLYAFKSGIKTTYTHQIKIKG